MISASWLIMLLPSFLLGGTVGMIVGAAIYRTAYDREAARLNKDAEWRGRWK